MSQPYLSLEAELHDAFWEAEDDASEVRLMADFLTDHPGPALEVGAGSGRLMFPLMAMAHPIEGLELSPDMLSLAEIRASQAGMPQGRIHLGDMSTWDPDRKFHALLAPAFTLQLAPDPLATLRHWHHLLIPGGGLYLTIFIPYAELLGDLPEDTWYHDHSVTLSDGREGLLETRHSLDLPGRRLIRHHQYTLTGTPPLHHVSTQSLRWFEHQEWIGLLSKAGFHCHHYFLDFDPDHSPDEPDQVDFDGIVTYHLSRADDSL